MRRPHQTVGRGSRRGPKASGWLAPLAVVLLGVAAVQPLAAAPPEILLHPVDQHVVTGDTTRFATATDPLVPAIFQWYHNGEPVAGATAPVLVIRNALPAHHGRYHAVARNADGEAHTRPAYLHLHDRPIGPGVTDTTFLAPLFAPGGQVAALARAAGGGVVVGGNFALAAGPGRHLVALDGDGNPVPTFAPHAAPPDDQVRALCPLEGGSILVAGDFTSFAGVPCYRIVRMKADGTPDPSFRHDLGTDDDVLCAAVQPDGKIVVGGKFLRVRGEAGWLDRPYLTRFHPDGSPDLSFAAGPVTGGPVLALAVQQGDGMILAGGSFTHAGGFSSPRVARLGPDGTPDPAFAVGPGANLQVRSIAPAPDGGCYLGGDFTFVQGVRRDRLARLHADGTLDLAFAAPCNLPVRQIACDLTTGDLLVAGRFTEIAGTSLRRVVRLGPNGTPDPAFDVFGLDEEVRTFLPDGEGKLFVGGDFSRPHGHVLRLHLAPPAGEFAPALLAPPAAAILPESDSLCLEVIARANPEPAYQWFRDGSPIEGAIGLQLLITDAGPADAGFYTASVSNPRGSASFAPVRVETTPLLPGNRTRHTVLTRPGAPVPQGGRTTFDLPVTEAFAVAGVHVFLSLSHPHTNQLDIDLVAPDGFIVELFDGGDKSGHDLLATAFDESSSVEIGEGEPPYVGTFRPEEPFAPLAGTGSAGTWRLRVRDDRTAGPPGTLHEFRLDLSRPTPPVTFAAYAQLAAVPAGDPSADANGDGHDNLAAFAFATAPEDPFRPVSIDRSRRVTFLHWSGPGPFDYAAEASADGRAWSPASPTRTYTVRLPDARSRTTLTFPPPSGAPRFFRVNARTP